MNELKELVFVNMTDEQYEVLVKMADEGLTIRNVGDETCPRCGYARCYLNPIFIGNVASCPRCDNNFKIEVT